MDSASFTGNSEMRGMFQGAWQFRHAVQEHRDSVIVEIVNHLEVVDLELVVALVGLEHTSSSRASIGRRLKRLAGWRNFDLLTQEYVTYAVAFDQNTKKRKATQRQLKHKLMQARFWACAEWELVGIDDSKETDRMLRERGGVGGIIPDGFFVFEGRGYFAEFNVGRDHFNTAVVAKSQKYYRNREYLCQIFDVDSFQVLWVSKLPGRVPHIIESLSTIGTGGLFLVANESDIDPFRTASVLEDIWISPKDRQRHALLGD